MAIKLQTGQAVKGENFFKRDKEIKEIWKKLNRESNILISAPRRVGKTSIMYYLEDNPQDEFIPIFLIVQSINDENEFYKRVLSELLKESSKVRNYFETTKDFLKKINIKSVGLSKVEFEREDLNYYDEFIKFVTDIELNKKIIIMIDEFAQAVENIKEIDKSKAIHFLQTNRELRQNREVTKKIQFIYAGSIGLENIVSHLNCVDLINDLTPIKINPLTPAKAKELIKLIVEGLEFELKEESLNYLIEKIEYLIPFYIQILLEELDNLYDDGIFEVVEKKDIDLAFENLLKIRKHFEHWEKRLNKSFSKDEFKFIKELLNTASIDKIDKLQITNLASKYSLDEANVKDIINSLEYDGYINNLEDKNIYRFNSPLIKKWWCENVAK